MVQVSGCFWGWFLLAGLPWIPPLWFMFVLLANLSGASSQGHQFVMSLKLKNMTGDNVLFKAVAMDIPLSGGR